MKSGIIRRVFFNSLEKPPIRHQRLSCKPRLLQRSLTTNTITPWISDDSELRTEKRLESQKAPTSLPFDQCTSSRALSQFYRGLASQDLDQIWPLYSTIYQSSLHLKLTRQNYRQLVLVTARSAKTQRNLHRLLALVEDMQQLGHPLRKSDYNMVMNWVGGATVPESRPRHLTQALGWLTTMESAHIEPCVVTYNTLIHVASQANDLLTAQRLYHAMLAKGIHADSFTYTTLLHCMAQMGDLQGVEEMMIRLERKQLGSLVQNTVSWNMLLDCYYTYFGKYGDTMTTMMEEDNDDTPMGSCQQTNSYQSKADSMFQSMVQALDQGITTTATTTTAPPADAITFQIYIEHLLRQDLRDDAIHTLTTLSTHRIQPTLTIYHHLFASFRNPAEQQQQEPQKLASSLLQQLYTSLQQQNHIRPTTETLEILVSALLDQHEHTLALKIFVQLSQQDPTLKPCSELLDRLSNLLQSLPPPS